jgi:DmsE family decaheme c-type cytochrome
LDNQRNGCKKTAPAAGIAVLLLLATALLAPHAMLAQTVPRQSETCLACHEEQQSNLVGGPHQIPEGAGPAARLACTDCHAGNQRHWEDDPAEYPMTNPARQSASTLVTVCASCHFGSHQQEMAEGNPHADDDIGCLGCHQVHGATAGPGSLRNREPELCLGCHGEVRGQFAKPSRHPVLDGVMTCSECHLVTDLRPTRLSYHGINAACFRCHPQFQGPFPYEHQATLDFSTEEGGCSNCHEPHGAYLPRMLRQPFEPPHFQLCSQCHYVPGHNFNTRHGTAWAGIACTDCHADIHGSYTNRLYLSAALEAQGCFAVGCHQP